MNTVSETGYGRISVLIPFIAAIGALGSALNLATGAYDTSLLQAISFLIQDDGSNAAFSVRELRLPRVLCAFGVGAALALSGALIQVITRNPLGDPGLTGVTGGAALGVAVCMTAITVSPSVMIVFGIAGGLMAAFMTMLIAGNTRNRPIKLILAGVAVSVFCIAATSTLMILSKSSLQTLYFWMIGGFTNRGWPEFSLFWPWALVGALVSLAVCPILSYLKFDDASAASMGLNAGRWRVIAGLASVVLAAASVAVAGPIGFIGFVTPHLSSLLLGRQQSKMGLWLVVSALVGGGVVAWSDALVRLVFEGRVPAGILITIVGGCLFLLMARRLGQVAR